MISPAPHMLSLTIQTLCLVQTDFLGAIQRHTVDVRTPIVVIDCGANDGSWGERMASDLTRSRYTNVSLLYIEANPKWIHLLKEKVRRFRGKVETRAVWNETGVSRTFYEGINSGTSSLVPKNARRYGISKQFSVRTVDVVRALKPYMKQTVILKYDIEGAEYETLPRLLHAGILCSVDYLSVEYHLNSASPETRLSRLGLQLSLPYLLERCIRGKHKVTIPNVEQNMNNYAVPGLEDLLQSHNIPMDKQK